MIGAILKGALRGAWGATKFGAREMTGRGLPTSASIGRFVSDIAGPRAGFVAGHAFRGAAKGALVGGGLWAATGNSDWMPLMVGAGAWMGGARGVMGSALGPVKTAKSATGRSEFINYRQMGKEMAKKKAFGWFNPDRLTRNMAIGTVAGVAMDDPNYAVYGGVGLPAARGFGKMMLYGGLKSGGGKLLSGKGLSSLNITEVTNLAGAAGLGAGLGYSGFKLATGMGSNQDVTAGYYPGGVQQLHPGGQGISNNHLSTEGLTLALHNNRRRTRVM